MLKGLGSRVPGFRVDGLGDMAVSKIYTGVL